MGRLPFHFLFKPGTGFLMRGEEPLIRSKFMIVFWRSSYQDNKLCEFYITNY